MQPDSLRRAFARTLGSFAGFSRDSAKHASGRPGVRGLGLSIGARSGHNGAARHTETNIPGYGNTGRHSPARAGATGDLVKPAYETLPIQANWSIRRACVSSTGVLHSPPSLVGIAYYLGAKVGLALTFQPLPISVLWPPNAVLLAALVLAPVRWWWLLLLGAFPAHFIAEAQGGVPAAMVLCWFVSNVSEAVIGALFVRRFMAGAPRLDSMRQVAVFICGAVLLAPFLSSFLDAAFVRLIGWGESSYGDLWITRFVSNMLATLTFVPVVMTWAARDGIARPAKLGQGALAGRRAHPCRVACRRHIRLRLALRHDRTYRRRFSTCRCRSCCGPHCASGRAAQASSFTIVALLVIWGAAHGRGPFVVGARRPRMRCRSSSSSFPSRFRCWCSRR